MTKIRAATFIQLDTDTLKIAQGSRTRAGTVLSALLVRTVQSASDEELSGALKESLHTLPVMPHDVEFILPRHFAIVRAIELPSTDNAEIRELAGFQAVKQTPYALDEMVMDVQVLEKQADISKVSLVVVQKEVVDRLLGMAEAQGLHVKAIRLSTQAYEGFFRVSLALRSPQDRTEGTLGLISIGQKRSHLLILSKGKCKYSRSLPIGTQSIASPTDDLDRFEGKLVEELDLSLAAYRKENPGSARIQKVFFDRGVQGWTLLKEFLQREGCDRTVSLDPMSIITRDPHAKIDASEDAISSSGDLFGALVGPDALTLNLLPEDYRQKMRKQARHKTLVQVAIFSSLLVSLCFAYFVERVIDKKMYLRHLRSRLASVRSTTSILESRNERLEMVDAVRQTQGEVLNVLKELYRLVPDSISLSALSYENGRSVTIKGTAKDLSDVFALIPSLEKSDWFENVSSQYASKRRIYDKEYTDFQIQCFIAAQGVTKGSKP